MDPETGTDWPPAADCAASKSRKHRTRKNGDGTVYFTGPRKLPWRATITRGWDVNGKVIRTSRFFANEEEAYFGLAEMIHRRDSGLQMPSRSTVKQIMRRRAAGRPVSHLAKPWRKQMSLRLRFAVFNRDGFTCRYCGRRPPETVLHVDHVHPLSKGGEDGIDNLVTACRECNLGKADRDRPNL